MKTAHDWMRLALEEAEAARDAGEIPIGAVLVRDSRLIARDHNRKEERSDASAHAEILVIREAGRKEGAWRLDGAELYATAEPCFMCWGAILEARIAVVVFGGASSNVGRLFETALLYQNGLEKRVKITGGVMEAESSALLREFFERRRSAGMPTGNHDGEVAEHG
ncbi:MAG: nucleoside deaminase [bacterium]